MENLEQTVEKSFLGKVKNNLRRVRDSAVSKAAVYSLVGVLGGGFGMGYGCGNDGGAGVCAPGDVKSCPCAGGQTGVQTCNPEGTAWGGCEGCSTPQEDALITPGTDVYLTPETDYIPSTCIDNDGDGYGAGCDSGHDCDDTKANINPGTEEICDGLDNNCNGQIDEVCFCLGGETQQCGTDTGECEYGTQSCYNGGWGDCIGEIGPANEVCDNKDNNCDGWTDESLSQPCSTICGGGLEYCVNGEWKNCDAPQPHAEICDDFDNDCDGKIDEEHVCPCSKYYQESYYLIDGKCCTYGEQGGLTCVIECFDLVDLEPPPYVAIYSPGPNGLTWGEGHLWMAEWGYSNKIYKITTSGQVVDSFSTPGTHPSDLAWDGKYLWHVDSWDEKIYQLTTTGQVIGSINSPDDDPHGLTWDGQYLWNANLSGTWYNKIYRLTTTGQIVSSFDSPQQNPRSLAWDGQHLWCVGLLFKQGWDEYYYKIHELTTTGKVLNSFDTPRRGPWGLTWGGGYLWVVDDQDITDDYNDNKICKLQITK